MTSLDGKIIVGSEEWCSFPDAGLPAIKARVDSGAATSSLHAINIVPFERDGRTWVSFEVHPLQADRTVVVRHEAPVLGKREVKNTSGAVEIRYVIKELMVLGEQSWEVELTLANRDAMGYRMLLGRQAMVGRILVDPEGSHHLREISPEESRALYAHALKRKDGLRIVLLASNPDLYSNRRIIEAGEERGHQMQFLNIRQCYIRLDPKNPEVHYRGGDVLGSVDAVIPRIRPSVTFYGCAVTRQFESMGVEVLNSAQAITASRDKLFASQEFVRSGLNTPITFFADSPLDTVDLIPMVGGKVVAAIERRAAEKEMAVKACNALDLDVAGVDILRSHRGPLLLEVNSIPGFEGIEAATGMDLAGKMIQKLERKLGWVRPLAQETPQNPLPPPDPPRGQAARMKSLGRAESS